MRKTLGDGSHVTVHLDPSELRRHLHGEIINKKYRGERIPYAHDSTEQLSPAVTGDSSSIDESLPTFEVAMQVLNAADLLRIHDNTEHACSNATVNHFTPKPVVLDGLENLQSIEAITSTTVCNKQL